MVTFCSPKRLKAWFSSFNHIEEIVKAIGGNKVLVVMDTFLVSLQIGLNKKIKDLLSEAGLLVTVYSGMHVSLIRII